MKSILLVACWILNFLSIGCLVTELIIDRFIHTKIYIALVVSSIICAFSAIGLSIALILVQ